MSVCVAVLDFVMAPMSEAQT